MPVLIKQTRSPKKEANKNRGGTNALQPGDEYCVSWAAAYSDAADVVASAPDMATVQQQVQRAQQLLRANLSDKGCGKRNGHLEAREP